MPGNELRLIATARRLNGNHRIVSFMNEDYFMIDPTEFMQLNGMKVALEGIVEDKPTIRTVSNDPNSWGMGMAGNLKDDHTHMTCIRVAGVPVVLMGVASLKRGEPVTVYGKIRGNLVQAKAIENHDVVYTRG